MSALPLPQPTLFDPDPPRFPAELNEARYDRDHSIDLALNASQVTEWKSVAWGTIADLADTGAPFTCDHILERAGLPRGGLGINANNSVGAIMMKACAAGVIRRTGLRVPTTRRSNKGRHVAEWVGCAA